jgi:5-methylcytosine-specific restriction endonuclease McrA
LKSHNTQECLPALGSIVNDQETKSGDLAKVVYVKSSSNICEADFTDGQPSRGDVKVATRKGKPVMGVNSGLRQNTVLVVDHDRRALTPCTPARARQLLAKGKATVIRRFPFTIILREKLEGTADKISQAVEIRIDPGSKETGIVIAHKKQNRVLFAMVLVHRGSMIKNSLTSRRSLRSSRRNRKTRYRQARFDNRKRPEGWLAPSLEHRVLTTMTWVNRFARWSPLDSIAVERVKFDMQKITNPEISGVEYQQGELQGFEVREYLLEKFDRTCVYCGTKNTPLQIEHIHPRAKGGSNKVSNLALACQPCNQKKGSQLIEKFLSNKPELLKKIKTMTSKSLSDASAVNSTRNKLLSTLLKTGFDCRVGNGAQTKYNRTKNKYPKDHWIDAACIGDYGFMVRLNTDMQVLRVKSMGHGSRQMCRTDKYGFPISHRSNQKIHFGFQTGDIVVASVPKGKNAGMHVGRVQVRARGSFNISKPGGRIQGINHKHCRTIQKTDGYEYQLISPGSSPSSPSGASGKEVL